ncbi:pyruvate dehydrogenase (acetyl-transferring), homodimeric type [Kangiella sp. HZ709]|uniref:pyruvate dehydrogenase (acetyl-transferring), homodimeric type n=1 Tax=Kangiella sp. HZ709 TaxID=2666328 RepID=UPI0012B1536D|nr:pyruvate dehydrogenase (acetyl-transferring), homodimeric type [Kangiella sp. HZ709]MRX27400.1 pyruvate dehydrogenase (acetyl-transferring), homodimeric type [Kangiella sp. HZ709]
MSDNQELDPLKTDVDPIETQEWIDALEAVISEEGAERAHYLLEKLVTKARGAGAHLPFDLTTAYLNTISPSNEAHMPGDPEVEKRIRAIIRWNAIAMVLQATKKDLDLGGHLSSFASSATLYDVGFNHFFHADDGIHGGDLIYYQGHCAPGIYARAFLEGRMSEEQMANFRQEVDGKGISSYPHPWLMPDFWQFPTVSMGLGPIQAIYQARFLKYLENRGLADTKGRKVWAFLGDGEMDEPESKGAIGLAGREGLDNLIFVVNCNLQRLDGPVRGNGKIIQELEGEFRGAGWNVLKVIWGRYWDPLIARDTEGRLLKVMEETVDGEYQNCKAKGGAYTREHFFGKDPKLLEMVANMSDKDIWRLNRGGHDPHKVYAAYHEAVNSKGKPTIILAKTVKGYGMGDSGEGKNISHQVKKMNLDALKHFRDRFNVPIPDEKLEEIPFYHPGNDSPEIKYLHERRSKLGGYLPARRQESQSLDIPELSKFDALLKSTGERQISTTMAFVRALNVLLKDKTLKERIVPIIPDEARTFGMEGLFRQIGIYSSVGQLYEPVDSDQIMYYREDKSGQILEEGINEAGAMSSWMAAATSYSSNDLPMIPFYILYSMFGFQRIGDLCWAAGDMQARGFIIGATSGRTTLNGEGLQHQDGHSHMISSTIPNCISYDPTYAYEVAVIMREGMRRMYKNQENVFYYITTLNENYAHPEMPEGAEDGIIKGMYQLAKGKKSKKKGLKVQLLSSGAILPEVEKAAELLYADFGVSSDIWSVTSFTELAREGQSVERENLLHPEKKAKASYVEKCLAKQDGPVIAATDYMKSYAEQIRNFVPANYSVLGTDGYGRSDSRANLRRFFEVDRYYVAVAALKALADEGVIDTKEVTKAIKRYQIDADKADPMTL